MRVRSEIGQDNVSSADQRMAELGNALAHPLRVALVRYLHLKNCGQGVENITCNKDLVDLFDYSQSTISQHVKILKDCGLFSTEVKNKFTYYYLNKYLLKEYTKSLEFEFYQYG